MNNVALPTFTFGSTFLRSLFPTLLLLLFCSKATATTLPQDIRGWEVIPNVIVSDGIDGFYVEINTNGPVNQVVMDKINPFLTPPHSGPIVLHDDGLDGDRIAGDFVHTAGPFVYNTDMSFPANYLYNANSPSGIMSHVVAYSVVIQEIDGSENQFLRAPYFGALRSDLPRQLALYISDNMIATNHVINVRTDAQHTQKGLRSIQGGSRSTLTKTIYEWLPDVFDFFMLISTNRLERTPRLSGSNFTAGNYLPIKAQFTGTGTRTHDDTALYGSNNGRLLGIASLDENSRGLNTNNATHELLHRWAARLDPQLGLTSGSHFKSRNTINSILGGAWRWRPIGNNQYMLDCDPFFLGTYEISPLEKYLMGLIDASEVADITILADGGGRLDCNTLVVDAIGKVSMDDIQAIHGVRAPGPAEAQRDFALAFVAESHNRFLNPTEMTFYSILAEYYTRPYTPDEATPFMRSGGGDWISIRRFFGEDTTWISKIPTQVPAPPQNLYARVKNYKVGLRWEESNRASSYDVYRKLNNQAAFEHIQSTTYNVLTDQMPVGTEFADYYVVAVSGIGESAHSKTIQVKPRFRIRR